ncbi:hypothetical protein FRC10_010619 [Ceratobasidium sp. 414]|nr:hypothetical protein FRC10_010619 [Ceratobasidium sp. 414]
MPPIDCIPSPILSDIFILTCYIGNREYHAHGRVPYVLASVCRLWRTVALSTPSLWSFIDAVLSPECVSTHLARSGLLPLDISLNTSRYSDDMFGSTRHVDADAFKKSLNLLHDNWARIRHFDVSLIANKHEPLVVDTLNDAINACDNDSLLSMFVHAKLFDENGWIPRLKGRGMHIFLPHSDTLWRIELNGIDLCLTPRLYTSPLLGLRELDLCSQSTISLSGTLFPLLELLPNLSHLSLHGHRLTDNWSASSRPEHSISLPMLETLGLFDIGGWACLNSTLRALDIPKLRSLRYSNSSDLDEGLVAVMRRCKLEVFELAGPCVGTMNAVLSNADSLGELKRLVVRPDSEEPLNGFIEEITRHLCEVAYCPVLEFLRVPHPPDLESVKAIDKLRSTRPSLEIQVESEPEESESETSD